MSGLFCCSDAVRWTNFLSLSLSLPFSIYFSVSLSLFIDVLSASDARRKMSTITNARVKLIYFWNERTRIEDEK